MFQLQAAQGKQPDALLLIREPSDEIPTCWRAMDPPPAAAGFAKKAQERKASRGVGILRAFFGVASLSPGWEDYRCVWG